MKYQFLVFMMFFLWGCSGDTSNGVPGPDNSCSCPSEELICISTACNDDQTCYKKGCYPNDHQILGQKKLFLVTKANPVIVSGDQLLLKVQALRTGYETTPKEIVGPIKNTSVTFQVPKTQGTTITLTDSTTGNSVTITPETSSLDQKKITTQTDSNAGIATLSLTATLPIDKSVTIPVNVILDECSDNMNNCLKRFSVQVDPRTKKLTIIGSQTPSVYSGGQTSLIVQLTTNNNLPYENEDVTFTIKNNSSTLSTLENETEANTVTVKTETGTGLTSAVFHAETISQDSTGQIAIVEVTSGKLSQNFNINIRPRPGTFCEGPDDCKDLGANYSCQNGICVYNAFCNGPEDCPDNFECKNNGCVPLSYICNPILEPDCACQDQNNCPDGYLCEDGKCQELLIDCTDDTPCLSYGLVCDTNLGLCVPKGSECKVAANCSGELGARPDICPNEGDCFCNNGNCIAYCPNSSEVEISGGSHQSCSADNDCADNELCVISPEGNKCATRWNGDYDFHLIHALPEGLQTFFNVLQKYFTGIVADFLMAELDFGLPSWLNWLVTPLQEALRDYLKQYIPDWVEDLVIGLDDSIQILQNMKVDAKLAFIHRTQHNLLYGIERWDRFFVYWKGDWQEVKPKDYDQNFQVNSSQFTGSVYCGLDENEDPQYYLEVDRHSAQFYFGYFILSFLENFLIPAVTDDAAHSIEEAVDLAIDCDVIVNAVIEFAEEYVGEWAYLLSIGTGFCEMGKQALVNKIYAEINKLHFGDEDSQKFTFSGGAHILVDDNYYSDEMIDGEYEGTLDLDKSRSFNAEWEADKAY